MTNSPLNDDQLLEQWRNKIRIANHHNIFCHCRNCQAEWIDSSFDVKCLKCGSINVESIACWQFPDD